MEADMDGVMARKYGGKCPHARIQYCPLYIGMHIVGGPSCWPANNDLDMGCAVDQGASYEALVTAFFRAYPADFAEVTLAERRSETVGQRSRNMRLLGLH